MFSLRAHGSKWKEGVNISKITFVALLSLISSSFCKKKKKRNTEKVIRKIYSKWCVFTSPNLEWHKTTSSCLPAVDTVFLSACARASVLVCGYRILKVRVQIPAWQLQIIHFFWRMVISVCQYIDQKITKKINVYQASSGFLFCNTFHRTLTMSRCLQHVYMSLNLL